MKNSNWYDWFRVISFNLLIPLFLLSGLEKIQKYTAEKPLEYWVLLICIAGLLIFLILQFRNIKQHGIKWPLVKKIN